MASPQKRKVQAIPKRSADSILPLHVALGFLTVKIYPLNPNDELLPIYSVPFTAAVLQIIAREILELSETPTSYASLLSETDLMLKREAAAARKSNDALRSRGQPVSRTLQETEREKSWLVELPESFANVADGCSFLDILEKELLKRISEPTEELVEFPEPVERRSPLGIFLRSLLITLRKLSFDETAHLARQVSDWCGISLGGPSRRILGGGSNRKSAMEDTMEKRTTALQNYQSASASGDYSQALASLRRFYDYQFPSATRGQHQHALLNLASFHYSTGGLESAKSAIDEAIRVARAEGDKPCLQHCMSLSSRIGMEMVSSSQPLTNRRIRQTPISVSHLPKSLSPMDELWAMKAALDMGEPVNIAFRRVYFAQGRAKPAQKDEKKETKLRASSPLDLAAWHATQAGLWTMLGSETLAKLHEDMTLVEEAEGDGQLTVLLSRAERYAGQGKYDESLAVLLDMKELEGMGMNDYHRWARTIWTILERRTSLGEDSHSLVLIESMRPPSLSTASGPGGPPREADHPPSNTSQSLPQAHEEIRAALRKAQKMQDAQASPHLILPIVLSVIELSASLSLLSIYRRAKIVLADIMLSMGVGLASKAINEVKEVWDQVLANGELETIALGYMVLGKSKIDIYLDEDGEIPPEPDMIVEAKSNLELALTAARSLGSRKLILQVTTLLSLLADLRGDEGERVKMMDEWQEASSTSKTHIESVRMLGNIIRLVGVRVAEGWQ